MHKIKQIPEDFIVDEIPNIKASNKGNYACFLLEKRNYTTMRVVEKVAEFLRTPLKNIGFAGNKDKNAITTQLISIKNIKKDRLKDFKQKDVSLKFRGYSNKPISLGDLEGNKFKITMRNLTEKDIKKKKILKIPNYFGEQRFSRNNKDVGKEIIKKNFKKALELIIKNEKDEKLKEYLKKNPKNFVGALRLIPKKILMLYVHSYQSFIWNKAVEKFLKNKNIKKIKNIKIPIAGFGTEFKNKEIEKIIKNILKKEKISLRDFIINQIPEISSEGNERNLFVEIKDLKFKIENDELNKGKKKCVVDFSLPKGSYATIVIKYLF